MPLLLKCHMSVFIFCVYFLCVSVFIFCVYFLCAPTLGWAIAGRPQWPRPSWGGGEHSPGGQTFLCICVYFLCLFSVCLCLFSVFILCVSVFIFCVYFLCVCVYFLCLFSVFIFSIYFL